MMHYATAEEDPTPHAGYGHSGVASTDDLYGQLRAGDEIVVRFGGIGTQFAIVHEVTRTGRVRVMKYRAKTGRWNNPVNLHPDDLVRRAERGEFKPKRPAPRK